IIMKKYLLYILLIISIIYSLIVSVYCLNEDDIETPTPEHQTFLDLSSYYIGNTQSPINLLTNRTQEKEHTLELMINDKVKEVENEEHTVKLELENGNYIESDGKKYEIIQIHFHTPSE